ncbi:epoxyqueuosine reductase [Haloferula luteola]|uniref:Epoxyqueuosine reductase n=1 Tax=Haloferula luteola TaxID=595692 RepID=A0A840VH92_9BACT|nr:tRNA epoxyqueuosine(34) reductase QueG [Haloferula luteola]MBB5353189.1 epoxyqueuosine reductase [Haloferula luteola]
MSCPRPNRAATEVSNPLANRNLQVLMLSATVTLATTIKQAATELGFDDCRIATAGRATHAAAFESWLDDGCHGSMAWLERNPHRRTDPREVLPGCRSIVTLALNYFPGPHPPTGWRIARYAWNEDYHDCLESKLKALHELMKGWGGEQRYYVDTGPVLERDFATDAGLGWNGKSTVQIHRRLGPWFFLAELLTTLEIEPDAPFGDHCGKCTRCLDACPTGAITQPHRVDARRCISYLTIENKGPIPEVYRRAIGNRLYGCDECLEVCPWNRFAQVSREATFHAREAIFNLTAREILQLAQEDFSRIFKGSPIKRIKLSRLRRNACVVLGNTGSAEDLPALDQAAHGEDALVAEHAHWAIAEIQRRLEASGKL